MKTRHPWARGAGLLAVSALATARDALAQMRFPPPEFESAYRMPTTQHPLPRSVWLEYADVLVLAGTLGLATWMMHRQRSRRWILGLGLFSVGYFGFYREGCICAIGSIQNVALAAGAGGYALPLTVFLFFALPLVTALFFGRSFCAAVCPHGALQDLVLIRPVKLPAWLDQGLGTIPFVYLGLSVLFAATGSAFVICQYDPFIAVFRLSGSALALTLSVGFLAAGTVIGRPYCRFLCPYGALLRIMSTVARWRVRITPDTCTQCSLCAESCPFGVIRLPAANPAPPGLWRAARCRFAWSLLALPLLVAAGSMAGARFGGAAARLHPDVRLATLSREQASGQSHTLTKLEEMQLTAAEARTSELLAAANSAEKRFHLGGGLFGAWLALVAGWQLLTVAAPRPRHDFEPDAARCFGCARCFASCPQEQVRLGRIVQTVSSVTSHPPQPPMPGLHPLDEPTAKT